MNAQRLLEHFDRLAEAPDAIPRLRRFILDLAVRGKLVEQDPNDEPAAELLKRIAAERGRLVKAGEIRKPKPLPSVDEKPFELARSWCWTRIREITSDRGQKVPDNRFTYIDVTAINKESGVVAEPKILEASEAPSRARKITKKGDVIYSCVRPYLLNVAVIDQDFEPEAIASTAFAVLNGYGLVVPRYLWIVLRSPFMVECVEESQRGQAYPAINDADFAVLPFPLPPLAEQNRIVAKVDELMALCDQLESAQAEREQGRERLLSASLRRLNKPAEEAETFQQHARFVLDHLPRLTVRPEQIKSLRQTILNLAVCGRLVPQDANDESASALLKKIAKEKADLVKNRTIKPEKPRKENDFSFSLFGLPSNWAWANTQAICISITDGDHLPPPKAEFGIPFLVIGDVRSKRINYSSERSVTAEYYQSLDLQRKPKKGDLLYTLVGSFGIPIEVREDQEFCVQRHIGILRPSAHIAVSFLAKAMESEFVYYQASTCATGIAQKTIPLSCLRKLLIPLPPLAEQHRIVAKLDELMAICDQLEAHLTTTHTDNRRLLEAVLHDALAPALADAA
jgi:type I restriction enzyme, S subunit